MNNMPSVDERSAKTLVYYVRRFHNVNQWFRNKPWRSLTKKDIQRVYDDLEDGKIKNRQGRPFLGRRDYYNKIFRSKPFELAGKAEIARGVLEFASHNKEDNEVRFITEEVFRQIASIVNMTSQKALLWLAFDIGENIHTLLDLQRKDFVKQQNPLTKEPEYIVNLPKEKLKRSRTSRSEITHYPDTVIFLDIMLRDLTPEDHVFTFGYRQGLKFIARAVSISGARCLPNGQHVTWKDLRSSMACDLLKKGWTTDEIKARLGHRPSSRMLDKYVNYLAIGRHTAKKKLYDNDLQRVASELDEHKDRTKLLSARIEEQQLENIDLKKSLEKLRPVFTWLEKIQSSPSALRALKRALNQPL
jgi:site-specific recombinase XerD